MLVAPRQRSGRRDALSPASQVARWWAESEELSRRAIEDAIVELLQGVLRSRTPLSEPSQARLLLQLAQLVAELELDERARTLLWSAAQHGRMSSDVAPLLPPDVEGRLLGWMAVIQVPEWLPAWQRLWRSPHTDLWAVAYSAIMNAAPDEAAGLLPELLDRRATIGDETCAFLVHSLLQEGVAWASALGHWWRRAARQTR
jgi:hypothetical protein